MEQFSEREWVVIHAAVYSAFTKETPFSKSSLELMDIEKKISSVLRAINFPSES